MQSPALLFLQVLEELLAQRTLSRQVVEATTQVKVLDSAEIPSSHVRLEVDFQCLTWVLF